MKKLYYIYLMSYCFNITTALAQEPAKTGGVVPATHYHERGDVGHLNKLSPEVIKKHTLFYGGDSLVGFDYHFWLKQSEKEQIELMVELQNYMHMKQSDFVKKKYHMTQLPFEKAKQPAYQLANGGLNTASSACGNLDFEDGNLNNWTCSSGLNLNSNNPLTIPAAGVGTAVTGTNHDIYACEDVNIITAAFNPANDPIINPTLDPLGGAFSIRLGGFHNNVAWNSGSPMALACGSGYYWDNVYSNGEAVSKTIAVTAANSLLSFDYAVVLNDGGHAAGSQPYFHAIITNTLGALLASCTEYYVQAQAGSTPAGFINSGYVSTNDGSIVYYKPWTTNSINLTPYIGQTIVINFSAAGCTYGAHCSWAYIDGICSSAAILTSNTSPCPGQNVTLTAPTVAGGTYSWYGPTIIGNANSKSVTVGGTGTYSVVVTPSQGSSCSYTLTQTINYNLNPVVTANASTFTVCAGGAVTLSGSGNASSYSWNNGVTNGVPFTPSSSGVYVVTGLSPQGCSNTSSIAITVNPLPTASIGATSGILNCTTASLTLSASGGGTYAWSGPGIVSGATTANPVINQPGNYNLVVTSANNCVSPTAMVTITQNTVVPSISLTTANSLTTTCANPTATLSATSNANPNTLYTWLTPTSGTLSGNPVLVNSAGTYTLVVTNTINGCTSSSTMPTTVQVSINGILPTVTLSLNSASLSCITSTVSANATANPAAVSYNWQPATGIVSGANTANPVFNMPGTYSVVVTNTLSGCSSIVTASGIFSVVSLTNAPVASVSVTSTNTAIGCGSGNNSVSYSASVSGSSGSMLYTWLPNPSTTSVTTITTPGTYTLQVKDLVSGCTALKIFTVTGNVIPPANLSAGSSVTIACGSSTTTLLGTTTSTNSVSYSWAGPSSASIISGAATASPTIGAAGVYTLTATDNVTGCSGTATVNVSSNTPTVTLSLNSGSLTCISTSVSTNATANPANVSYNWQPAANIVSGANTANPVFNLPGTYSVVVTNTLSGCSSIVTASGIFSVVSLTNTPVASAVAISTNTVIGCSSSNNSVTYSASVTGSSGSMLYTWLPNPSTTSVTTITTPGTYTLLVKDLVSGCAALTIFTVTGNVVPPANLSAGSSVTIACGSSTATLLGTTTSTNSISYSWAGPSSASIISGATTASPTIGAAGIYTLTATDNVTGCSGTATVSVSSNNVTAGISATPITGIAPLTVNFTEQCSNATHYSWNFGNTNTGSTLPNPSNVYVTEGSYTVTLIASSASCYDTAYVVIIVDADLFLEIPNVFTPNGDNMNDLFMISSKGVKEISMEIFNRWGERLYSFTGVKASWDGKTGGGEKVPEGTYFYLLSVKGYTDKIIEKHGYLNLFR